MPERAEVSAGPGRRGTLVTLAVVLLVSVNLRFSITAVAPVLDNLRADLDLSRGTAGLLTAFPVLLFGLLAPAAAYLGSRLGTEAAMLMALVGLFVGILVRSAGGPALVIAGTVLLGAGVAVGNVLVPSLVKRDLANLIGPAMALYTAMLTGGAALAAVATAALVAGGWTWRPALAVGALPALLVALVFGWWASRRPGSRRIRPDARVRGGGRVWRSSTAWQLSIFMAGQAFLFYSVLAWLPALLQERGVSLTESAWMLSVYNLVGIIGALVVPPLATRSADQRVLAVVTAAGWIVGVAGLWLLPDLYVLWSVVLGLIQGAGISMALTLIVLRAGTTEVARDLSAMVQMIGYLCAALGPWLVGALRDGSGGWGWSLATLLGAAVVMSLSAVGAGRPRSVG